MSVGSLGGLIGSAAGVPLSQSTGSETERASRDTASQQRVIDASNRAEQAAGIGTTEQDQETSDRDADGRRLWEEAPNRTHPEDQQNAQPRQSRDATGHSGTQLDLTG